MRLLLQQLQIGEGCFGIDRDRTGSSLSPCFFQVLAVSDPPQAGDWALMPEMAHTGEDHGEAGSVGRRDHIGVAHRAARLDHRGRPGLGDHLQPVGEGEERI